MYTYNEVDAAGDYYHMPNVVFYPSLFAWDSGFHAVTMLHLDPEKSKRELETLFRHVSSDGHMPHEVLAPSAATRVRPWKSFMRWLFQWAYDPDHASHLIDPPIYVHAARLAFEKTGDAEWLRRIWEDLCRCLDYLLDERDLFGDGLVSIVHPWEAGTDLSGQLLPALGIDPGRRRDVVRATTCAMMLYRFNNVHGWRGSDLKAVNRFVVEDLTMNSITIRALGSAAELAEILGDEAAALRYSARAAVMSEALDAVCWDEEAGCYFPRWNAESPRLARVRTAASLLPLFTGLCDRERARRMIGEHLLDEKSFWTEHPLPFTPEAELAHARPWVDGKLWAGHCVWMNFNWMLAVSLVENGFVEEARELTTRTARMILNEGFYEYYDSRTGSGKRIRDFTWPGLVLDMIETCATCLS